MRLPPIGTLIRASVLLTVLGLLLLLPVLFEINALNVGLVMLGAGLIAVGLLLYLSAVVRDLRRREAL